MRLTGKRVIGVRALTSDELRMEGWVILDVVPVAIELEGGITLYPSADVEGNALGVLIGYDREHTIRIEPETGPSTIN